MRSLSRRVSFSCDTTILRSSTCPPILSWCWGVYGPCVCVCVCVCVISPLHSVPLAGRCPTDAPGPPNPAKAPRAVGQWCFPCPFILSAGTVCVYIQRNMLFQKALHIDRLGIKGKVQPKMRSFPPVSRCSARSPPNISRASQLNSNAAFSKTTLADGDLF